jgi:hypothetical protein
MHNCSDRNIMKCTKHQLTWEDDIKTFLQKLDVKAWNGLDWLMTDRSGLCTFRLLWSWLTKAWNTLRMEAASSSKETQIYQCPWRHIPEDTWSSPWRCEISRRRDVNLQSTWRPESNQKFKKGWLSQQPKTRQPTRFHLFTSAFINIYTWAVSMCLNIHMYIYMYLNKLIVLHTYIHAYIYIYIHIHTYGV